MHLSLRLFEVYVYLKLVQGFLGVNMWVVTDKVLDKQR